MKIIFAILLVLTLIGCQEEISKKAKTATKTNETNEIEQINFAKALDQESESGCRKISDDYLKDSCFLNLAGLKKDQTLCAKVSDPTMNFICTDRIAKGN